MLNYFQIEDDLDVMDIEINKVDQQKYELNKYQPRKMNFILLILLFIFPTSAINGSSSTNN
jgi:hypothetical protein